MTNLRADILRSVRDHLERHRMSARRFGTDALGDESLVASLARGRTLRLGTADRVLAFMGEAPIGPVFRREVEAFLAVTRTKVSVLGAHGARNPSFVARLRRGLSPSLETVDRVRAWMAAHSSPAEARAIRAAVAAQSSEPAGGDALAPAVPVLSSNQGERSMKDGTSYMSTREVAAFLGLSPRTLDRYRVSGAGPKFHKFGSRVRYLRADVEAWTAERCHSSTSDEAGAARRAA